MPLPWSQNDTLFLEECRKGHYFERYVASVFRYFDFKVQIGEQSFRSSIHDAGRYLKSSDLLIDDRWVIEVKSRNLRFTCPEDFPYDNILVDTYKGWRAKSPMPHYVVCVSQATNRMIVTPSSAKDMEHWSVVSAKDGVRGIYDLFYQAPREVWMPLKPFLEKLGRERAAH